MRWSLIRKRLQGEDPRQEPPRRESVEQRQESHPFLKLAPPPPARGLHPFRSGLGIHESAIADAYRAGEAPPPYIPDRKSVV